MSNVGGALKSVYQPQLDGLRGLMALWVFFGHTAQMCAFTTPLIPNPGNAVDIFMLLSGLLMTRNFLARENKEPLASWTTIKHFLLRRFFRIAPLYYPTFLVAILMMAYFGPAFDTISLAFPSPWADQLANDPSNRALTATNVITHLSFLFGLFPQYAANNLLPDWSLSLEMQFYLVLPFLLLLARRTGYTAIVVAATIATLLMSKYVGLYLHPTALGLWPQPAILPFRINCFMAGILIATYEEKRDLSTLILLFVVAFVGQKMLFTVATIFCLLMMESEHTNLLGRIGIISKRMLSTALARFLGEVSYAVYLVHLLLLLPICWLLVNKLPGYIDMAPFARFALLATCTAALLLPLAYGLYRYVELPGIALGRRFTGSKAKTPGGRLDDRAKFLEIS